MFLEERRPALTNITEMCLPVKKVAANSRGKRSCDLNSHVLVRYDHDTPTVRGCNGTTVQIARNNKASYACVPKMAALRVH